MKNGQDKKANSAPEYNSQAESGIRPPLFGIKTLIAAVVLTLAITLLVIHIAGGFGGDKDNGPGTTEPPVTVIPPPPPPPIDPPPDPNPNPDPDPPSPPEVDSHPLAGPRYILCGNSGNWRHAYLSWTYQLGGQSYPLATVEHKDPCVWELTGVPGSKDVYRITYLPADANDAWAGAELSYTVIDSVTHVTVESGDPCKWKIIPMGDASGRYRIVCDLETIHDGESISPLEEHELETGYPIAVLKRSVSSGWKIVPVDELPEPIKPVTHVIIFPRRGLDQSNPDAAESVRKWAEDMVSHIEDDGWETLRVTITLADENTIETSHRGLLFKDVVTQLRQQNDNIAEILPGSLKVPDLINGLGGSGDEDLNDIRKVEPFPVVIPLISDGYIKVENIRSLEFWDDGFFTGNKGLELVREFQKHLDPNHHSDRVFHGEKFTYVFVSL